MNELVLEDKKSFDKCKICFYDENPNESCPYYAKLPLATNKEELKEHLLNPIDPRPLGTCEYLKAKEDITHNEIADYIQSQYFFKTMIDNDDVYYYQDGIYVQNAEKLIRDTVEKIKNPCTANFKNEVVHHIIDRTHISRESFDKDPNLLTLKNGILDIENMQIHDFDPSILSLSRIPLIYDKEAQCPTIEKFLSEIVSKEDIQTLYEIAGYCLLKSYFIHKAFMLIGDTHSGKSTYINLLNAMIGEENISHESIQNLLTNRFAPSELYGKLINSYADLPNTALKQTGLFKILTGEDYLHAEKKLKNPFKFKNMAKLIFSCNDMPKTYDKGDAFYIRWILINYPNRFDDKNPNTDKKLLQKLITQQELSGFLNKAIDKAKTLLEQEHFTNNPDVEDIRQYYEKLSNPIYAFMIDSCEFDEKEEIPRNDFYQRLMQYCEERRLSKPTMTYLTQELKRQRIEVVHGIGGVYSYKGIRWKTDEEKAEEKTLDEFK